MITTLEDLGWSPFFRAQWQPDPAIDETPLRIAEVHRTQLTALGLAGTTTLTMPPDISAGDIAVGDWVLAGPDNRVAKVLDRQTLLSRRAAGTGEQTQLIAANVDTLFITSSCNADFNPARIERYLALAHDAGCFPVLLLTKADMAEDAADYQRRAALLADNLMILTVNALDPGDLAAVGEWCRPGQTAALVGSSGVGKSTIMNGLTGDAAATQAIRENDAKGRHTTTHRTLRRMLNGGWLIDTPGMRSLPLNDAGDGIDELFDDISALTTSCRFSDCRHQVEPGCAILSAVADGDLDPDRLARWRKLHAEDVRLTETYAQTRNRQKGLGKMIKTVQRAHKDRKG